MPERKKLLLRLDPRVYDAVAKWAADDLRSVNAQIEYALRLALRSAGREPRQRPPDEPGSAAQHANRAQPTSRAKPEGQEE
jgi:hypothetical protein